MDFVLQPELVAQLRLAAADTGQGQDPLCLAALGAFQVLLARYSRQVDVIVGLASTSTNDQVWLPRGTMV